MIHLRQKSSRPKNVPKLPLPKSTLPKHRQVSVESASDKTPNSRSGSDDYDTPEEDDDDQYHDPENITEAYQMMKAERSDSNSEGESPHRDRRGDHPVDEDWGGPTEGDDKDQEFLDDPERGIKRETGDDQDDPDDQEDQDDADVQDVQDVQDDQDDQDDLDDLDE